jgi:hypothetical protein
MDSTAAVLSGPSDELEARVLEGLAVPRAVGDLLFLLPALGEAGRPAVDAALERLSELGLVRRRPGGRLWKLTETGSRWIDEQAEWQIRVAEVFEQTSRGPVLTGTLDRGIVKVGDWFHDGVGNTGRVVAVDRFAPDSGAVSIGFESNGLDSASALSPHAVIRRWSPLGGHAGADALSPPEWNADMFRDDLDLDGSLPDITAPLAEGRSWHDLHAMLDRSGLRWEARRGGIRLSEFPPLDDVFARNGDLHFLTTWVGPVQFNAHYWTRDELDFDVEISALADRSSFECLVTFMDWLASVAGADARLTHEGLPDGVIRVSTREDSSDEVVVRDRLRLAELRNPVFGTYREVVAPAWRLDQANIDAWLERHRDPDAVISVLCHVHLWDEIESTDDEVVLGRVAATIAERWRAALAAQLPDRIFEVGVAGEPDEYGPTVWARTTVPASGRGGGVDHFDSGLRDRLIGLAAARWVGGFRAEAAVSLASELLAAGVDHPAVVELAIQPADPRELRDDHVRSLFDACCVALGVATPTKGVAGWQRARDISAAIIAGVISPATGAAELWPLWEECGTVPGSSPLDMLQLSEEWERSVGVARAQAEQRIVSSARSVVADADRALAALAMPPGYIEGIIRARDVMPLLLNAAPSFLSAWYEIEDDHLDRDKPGGRLHYLDAGAFARHVIELYRSNHRVWLQNAFAVIERMHTDGDAYVAELATIGYLEDIQNMAGHAGVDPAVFVPYLGAESARWWRGLDRFWAGEHPAVEPNDDEPGSPAV